MSKMFSFQLPSERISHRTSRFLSKVALVDNNFINYSREILCVLLSLLEYFHCLVLYPILLPFLMVNKDSQKHLTSSMTSLFHLPSLCNLHVIRPIRSLHHVLVFCVGFFFVRLPFMLFYYCYQLFGK